MTNAQHPVDTLKKLLREATLKLMDENIGVHQIVETMVRKRPLQSGPSHDVDDFLKQFVRSYTESVYIEQKLRLLINELPQQVARTYHWSSFA